MAKEKAKKPFYKKWWFWLIVVIVCVGAAGTSEEEKDNAANSNEQPKQEKVEVSKDETSLQENKEEVKENENSSQENKTNLAKNKRDVKIGEEATYLGTTVKVDEIKWLEPNEFMDVKQGDKVLGVKVTIKNTKNSKLNYNALYFKLNVDGQSEDTNFYPATALGLDGETFESGDLEKDASYTGWLVFNADPNANKLVLEYRGSVGNNAKIKVDLK